MHIFSAPPELSWIPYWLEQQTRARSYKRFTTGKSPTDKNFKKGGHMGKRKREENLDSREEKETGQLIASSFRKLTAEELFQLAAHLEVRSATGVEAGSQYTLHPYVE
jgi:hypothetical protein